MIRPAISRVLRVGLCVAAAVILRPLDGAAQVYSGRDIPHRGNVEITGGAVWSAGYSLESTSADETRNTGTGTGPYVLISASSKTEPSF